MQNGFHHNTGVIVSVIVIIISMIYHEIRYCRNYIEIWIILQLHDFIRWDLWGHYHLRLLHKCKARRLASYY